MEKRLSIYLEAWKRRRFDFITVVDGKKHIKQEEALMCLTDNVTAEFLYGGGAGSGKSFLGCVWIAFMCMVYPGVRYFFAREELKRVKDSTLITFYKVCRRYGIEVDKDFKFNGQDNYIQFANGSRIDLLDLKYLPSDPLWERLGSVEWTGGMVDESAEIDFGAFDVLKSRVGRCLNDEYGLLRKLFLSCNPRRCWLYSYFYKPHKNNNLLPYQKFLPALISDNPHIEKGYEESLKSISDPVKKARLLYGEWEYDTDPAALVDYQAILDVFTNDHAKPGEKYISADIAFMGRDRFVACVWNGMICRIAIDQPLSTGKSVEDDLKGLMKSEGVGRSHVISDSDGLGSYLGSYLEGIVQFHAGARAINDTEFANIKSECAYKLAELINKREIKILCTAEQKEKIIEELSVLKADKIDADEQKKRIIKKDKMKEVIQRSPDFLDAILFRAYFLLQPAEIWWTGLLLLMFINNYN